MVATRLNAYDDPNQDEVSVQIPPLRTLRELILVLIEGSDWYELLDRGYSYGQLLFMKNMPLVEQSGSLNSDWCLLI